MAGPDSTLQHLRAVAEAPEVCPFCRRPTWERGCQAGRCASPRASTVQEPPRPRPEPVGKAGERREVVTSELREGENGGLHWVLELVCGHIIWQRAGRRPKAAPRQVTCMVCTEGPHAPCSVCGKQASWTERMATWGYYQGHWRCQWCDSAAVLERTLDILATIRRNADVQEPGRQPREVIESALCQVGALAHLGLLEGGRK